MPDFSFLDDDQGSPPPIRINTRPPRRGPAPRPQPSRAVGCLAIIGMAIGISAALVAARPPLLEKEVSRGQFGAEWPLTVSRGRVRAYRDGRITFVVGGTEYAVNGTARGRGFALPPVEAIVREGENCGELLTVGLELRKRMGE